MKKRFYLLAMLYMGSSLLWAKGETDFYPCIIIWKASHTQ